jgi:hypothetical protein
MRKNPKLLPPWLGPFKVLSKTSSVTYRLELPPKFGFHPVVYVGLLKPYVGTPPAHSDVDAKFAEEFQQPVDVSEFQTPERILDKKINRRGAYYLVKWKDAPFHEATWEPGDELMLAFPTLVDDYEATL